MYAYGNKQSQENQGNVKDNRYIIDNYITVINFFLALIDLQN